MSDLDHRLTEEQIRMSGSIIDLTSSFTVCSHMLSLAGNFTREQVHASNVLQLNSISAMMQLVREFSDGGRSERAIVNEALDLTKQVVAAAEAS